MEIEYVAGIGFAAGGTTQQQGDLTVSDSLFGKVIIDDECGLTTVAEIFPYRGAGEGCIKLDRSRVGSRSGHNDGIIQGAVVRKGLHHACDGGSLLANRDIDTVH